MKTKNQPIFVAGSLILLLFLVSLHCKLTDKHMNADLVIINSNIWTADSKHPKAEALAVVNDTLAEIGSTEEIRKWIGSNTNVINAKQQFVLPGFIDSHVHFLEGGMNLASVQLRDAKSPQEFINRIKDFCKTIKEGEWITGGDWDHENWGGVLPERSWIDSVTPKNPVWINRLDGHMSLANSLALRIAKVDAKTKDINGGTIVRSKDGQPTGILKDNAMGLVDAIVPQASETVLERALIAAMNYVAAQGVTSVHNMTAYHDGYRFLSKMSRQNKLITRIYCSLPLYDWKFLHKEIMTNGNGDKWLKIGGLKGFIDGSLGSHTAAFVQPYSDKPNDKGLFVMSEKELFSLVDSADLLGFQAVIHAIGDNANNLVLNVFEKIINKNGPRDRRFRIEHAQHLLASDISRFASLKVIASMQPYHCIDDGRWAEKIIGPERIKTTYAFRSLLDAGAKLSFGSDWYVAPPVPLMGIYAAVTRRTLDEKNPSGWIPQQKITVIEALKAYTIDAAYASFEEKIKGSLEKGKLADITILDQDITQIDPVKIREVKVVMTIVGGKIIYKSNL